MRMLSGSREGRNTCNVTGYIIVDRGLSQSIHRTGLRLLDLCQRHFLKWPGLHCHYARPYESCLRPPSSGSYCSSNDLHHKEESQAAEVEGCVPFPAGPLAPHLDDMQLANVSEMQSGRAMSIDCRVVVDGLPWLPEQSAPNMFRRKNIASMNC